MWQYKQKKNYRIEPGNIAVYVRVARQAVFRPHKAVFINFAHAKNPSAATGLEAVLEAGFETIRPICDRILQQQEPALKQT